MRIPTVRRVVWSQIEKRDIGEKCCIGAIGEKCVPDLTLVGERICSVARALHRSSRLETTWRNTKHPLNRHDSKGQERHVADRGPRHALGAKLRHEHQRRVRNQFFRGIRTGCDVDDVEDFC